jgi:hypothetical protein
MAAPNGDEEASFAHDGALGDAQSTYERGNQFAQQGAFDRAEAYRRADERGDGFGAFRLGLLLAHRSDWGDQHTPGNQGPTYAGRADLRSPARC